MTAEEYLSWVSDQARRLPLVMRVNPENVSESRPLQPAYPQLPSIPTVPAIFNPEIIWEREVLKSFALLRKVQ